MTASSPPSGFREAVQAYARNVQSILSHIGAATGEPGLPRSCYQPQSVYHSKKDNSPEPDDASQPEPEFVPEQAMLDEWLNEGFTKPLLVIAPVGSGKSSLLESALFHLTANLLKDTAWRSDVPTAPVPLFIRFAWISEDIRSFIPKAEFFLYQRQVSSREIELKEDVISYLIELNQMVLLLDGYDEVPARHREFERELKSFDAAGLCYILSSRPGHGELGLVEDSRHRFLPAVPPDTASLYVRQFLIQHSLSREDTNRISACFEEALAGPIGHLLDRYLYLNVWCRIVLENPKHEPPSSLIEIGKAIFAELFESMLMREEATSQKLRNRYSTVHEQAKAHFGSWLGRLGLILAEQDFVADPLCREPHTTIRALAFDVVPGATSTLEEWAISAGLLTKPRTGYQLLKSPVIEYLIGNELAQTLCECPQSPNQLIETFRKWIWRPAFHEILDYMFATLWEGTQTQQEWAGVLLEWSASITRSDPDQSDHKRSISGGDLKDVSAYDDLMCPFIFSSLRWGSIHSHASISVSPEDIVAALRKVFRFDICGSRVFMQESFRRIRLHFSFAGTAITHLVELIDSLPSLTQHSLQEIKWNEAAHWLIECVQPRERKELLKELTACREGQHSRSGTAVLDDLIERLRPPVASGSSLPQSELVEHLTDLVSNPTQLPQRISEGVYRRLAPGIPAERLLESLLEHCLAVEEEGKHLPTLLAWTLVTRVREELRAPFLKRIMTVLPLYRVLSYELSIDLLRDLATPLSDVVFEVEPLLRQDERNHHTLPEILIEAAPHTQPAAAYRCLIRILKLSLQRDDSLWLEVLEYYAQLVDSGAADSLLPMLLRKLDSNVRTRCRARPTRDLTYRAALSGIAQRVSPLSAGELIRYCIDKCRYEEEGTKDWYTIAVNAIQRAGHHVLSSLWREILDVFGSTFGSQCEFEALCIESSLGEQLRGEELVSFFCIYMEKCRGTIGETRLYVNVLASAARWLPEGAAFQELQRALDLQGAKPESSKVLRELIDNLIPRLSSDHLMHLWSRLVEEGYSWVAIDTARQKQDLTIILRPGDDPGESNLMTVFRKDQRLDDALEARIMRRLSNADDPAPIKIRLVIGPRRTAKQMYQVFRGALEKDVKLPDWNKLAPKMQSSVFSVYAKATESMGVPWDFNTAESLPEIIAQYLETHPAMLVAAAQSQLNLKWVKQPPTYVQEMVHWVLAQHLFPSQEAIGLWVGDLILKIKKGEVGARGKSGSTKFKRDLLEGLRKVNCQSGVSKAKKVVNDWQREHGAEYLWFVPGPRKDHVGHEVSFDPAWIEGLKGFYDQNSTE